MITSETHQWPWITVRVNKTDTFIKRAVHPDLMIRLVYRQPDYHSFLWWNMYTWYIYLADVERNGICGSKHYSPYFCSKHKMGVKVELPQIGSSNRNPKLVLETCSLTRDTSQVFISLKNAIPRDMKTALYCTDRIF